MFEKRAPALLDNLLLTLVAPNFVILEILFALGYKPEVKKNVEQIILNNIR